MPTAEALRRKQQRRPRRKARRLSRQPRLDEHTASPEAARRQPRRHAAAHGGAGAAAYARTRAQYHHDIPPRNDYLAGHPPRRVPHRWRKTPSTACWCRAWIAKSPADPAQRAEGHAVTVFARNLRSKLLRRPRCVARRSLASIPASVPAARLPPSTKPATCSNMASSSRTPASTSGPKPRAKHQEELARQCQFTLSTWQRHRLSRDRGGLLRGDRRTRRCAPSEADNADPRP